MALTVEQNREVIKASISAMAALDQALTSLAHNCSQADFDHYRHAFGRVMGEISSEVLNPLFERYPELEPQSPEEWRVAGGLPEVQAGG